ncbi:MAG: hypothetical protein CMJ46_10620 [Planctomyces sp.]|nr:hypothetical protein [Planctomyces sp.]
MIRYRQGAHPDLLRRSAGERGGFTIIELLVSIVIIGILTVMTVLTLNATLENSKVNSASRSIQAALEGARDRAAHANEPRGLRIYFEEFVDANGDSHFLANSMAYLEVTENETAGTIDIQRVPVTVPPPDYGEAIELYGTDTDWQSLHTRGLLTQNSKIRLNNWWYTIAPGTLAVTVATEQINITPEYRDATGTNMDLVAGSVANGDHEITLEPVEMAGEDPISLPEGTFIDLAEMDRVPLVWEVTGANGYVDIMFDPLGTVNGPLSTHGMLHLPIIHREDIGGAIADIKRFGNENKENQEGLITVFTQTGQITTPPIWTDPTGSDPYLLVRKGATE